MQIILFILFLIHSLFSNEIKEIIISGNEITNTNFILETINHQPGDTVNIDIAIDDQYKLYQTGLFYDVIIQPADSLYYIYVFEKPKIQPKPLVDKHDQLGWSYGGSVLFNNIQGFNKKLKLSTLAGKTTLYDISYMDPILDSTKDSLLVNIYKKYFRSAEDDYAIKKYGFKGYLAIPNNYDNQKTGVEIKYEHNKIIYINNLISNIFSLETSFHYYKNKLTKNNQNQHILNIQLLLNLYKEHFNHYGTLKIKSQYYIPINIGKILLKNQMILNSINNIPIYKKIYLDTETYVRGYEFDSIANLGPFKWNNILVSTLQFEFPFYKKNLVTTKLLLFYDWGVGFDKYSYINQNNLLRGYGFGIRFSMIKLGEVDICFGYNPYGGRATQAIVNFKNF